MKVEKRGDSCFISHNGLTLFFNKRFKADEMLGTGDYQIKVQKQEGEQWHTVGTMEVDKAAYLELLNVMKDLL